MKTKEDTYLVTQTAYQIVGKGITSLLGFAMTYMLARYLGVQGFGQYNFILALVGLSFWFADFGLEPVVIRKEASGSMSEKDFSSFVTLRLVLVVLTFIGVSIASIALPYTNFIRYGIVIAGLGQALFTFASIILTVLKGRLQYAPFVMIHVAVSSVHILLVIVGVVLQLPPLFFFVAFVAGYLAGLGIAIKISPYRIRWTQNWISIRSALREALPFAMAVLVSVAAVRIDTLMLGYFFNPDIHPDVGYYALGLRIFDVVIVLGGYYTQTLFPYFSQQTSIVAEVFRKHLMRSLLLAGGAFFGMFVFAEPVVRLLGGGAFSPSVHVIHTLMYAAAITIVLGFYNSYLLSVEKEKVWLKIATGTLIINVVFNGLLIPSFSFIGVSWATVIAQSMALLFTAGYVHRYRRLNE